MRKALTRLLLALVLLGAGGVVVGEDHRGLPETPAGAVLSQFSLLALIEAHDPGGNIALERHPVCTDCTGLGTVVGLIAFVAIAARLVGFRALVRDQSFAMSSLAFSPLAPPPR